MHFEIDFGTWTRPKSSTSPRFHIQRGKDGYARREVLKVAKSDMFRAELDMFADSIASGKPSELSADNANVSLAVVYGALRSLERGGQSVKIADIINEAKAKI